MSNLTPVHINEAISAKYDKLESKTNKIMVEYVWIGGTERDLRSKTRTCDGPITSTSQLPVWNFDGSSTLQAPGIDSEINMAPCTLYNDPFRRTPHQLVMCQTAFPFTSIDDTIKPIPTNKRAVTVTAPSLEQYSFTFTTAYHLLDPRDNRLLGAEGPLLVPGQYKYGTESVEGRSVAEAHLSACLYAGIPITAIFPGAYPGSWSYTIGPVNGIKACDDLWMSRYILIRVCEDFGVRVKFDTHPSAVNFPRPTCSISVSYPGLNAQTAVSAINKLSATTNGHTDGVTQKATFEHGGIVTAHPSDVDPYVATYEIVKSISN